MKIVIDNKIPFIQGRLEPFAETLYLSPQEFSPENIKDADALVIRTRTLCNSSLLEGSCVRLIVTATIGTDHIDIPWCENKGIKVVNAAGCNAPGVAQYVWVNLLANGFDPALHSLGIIGYGNIGSIVADYATRLGVKKIMVNDPIKERNGLADFSFTPLHELLKEVDAVTIHTPLTFHGEFPTFKLLSTRELNLMKPGAFLINAARGGIVDEKALIKAIDEKKIKAIVDVWESEPIVNSELLSKSIVVTPHIAGYSRQGKSRATGMALEALDSYFGFTSSKVGLQPPWKGSGKLLNPDFIVNSYDFKPESLYLKRHPGEFEKLRENYNFRDELEE